MIIFSVTLSPVEYWTVEHSTFTTFEKTRITINWHFSRNSKQIYRQLQFKEKVFASLSQKNGLYLSTKFDILNPWTNIQSLRRFNLGFWQTSKQIYRKLQYREKVFGEFQALPRFPRKMVVRHFPRRVVMSLLRKFCIFQHCTIIQLFRRFDLRFWKNLKQIYRKLQYEEKFSRFCLVFRKMTLYLLTKLYIFEPCTNMRSLSL